MPFLKSNCLNWENSYFKLTSQLNHDDIGKFIKSNSGYKLLTGQILDTSLYSAIKQNQLGLIADDLLFISPKKNIEGEIRFWIFNDTIIEYSAYSWDDNIKDFNIKDNILKEAIIYVQNIINIFTIDLGYVIDIAYNIIDNLNIFKVIEINSFSCSGFYNSNISNLCNILNNYYNC